MSRTKFALFTYGNLESVLESQFRELEAEIQKQADNYLLNVGESTYLQYLVGKYQIDNLTIKVAEKFIEHEERDIPAERFPSHFFVREGKHYPRIVLRIHVPVEGELDLLKYMPNPAIMWTEDAEVGSGLVIFERILFTDEPEQIKKEIDDVVGRLQTQVDHIVRQVQEFNETLPERAKSTFLTRREQILKTHSTLAAIGIPIKRKGDSPDTFSVPSPKKKQLDFVRPSVTDSGFTPEPALNNEAYYEILSVLHKAGQEFEKHPALYKDKNEEALRDHLIFALTSSFDFSSTGETFNKIGKVDILLKHQARNIFAAECKFWSGPASYLRTLTQLMGYLTWRDSKASVVIFVRSQDFTSVVNQVRSLTPQHDNYVRSVNEHGETWFEYRFHLPGDTNREIWMTALLFHLPKLTSKRQRL